MSSIAILKRAIRWQPMRPAGGPRCDNCKSAQWIRPHDKYPDIKCNPYGFYTRSHATCERHQPKEPT